MPQAPWPDGPLPSQREVAPAAAAKRCLFDLTLLLQEAGLRADPPAGEAEPALGDLQRSFDRCEATPPHLRDLELDDHAPGPTACGRDGGGGLCEMLLEWRWPDTSLDIFL